MFVDIAVLIYFIHHIAVTIQLPEVIARIAKDLGKAIDEGFPEPVMEPKDARNRGTTQGPPHSELQASEVNGPSATELTPALTPGTVASSAPTTCGLSWPIWTTPR